MANGPLPMPLPRSIVIHGHYYQPPRENPWLDMVEAEPSAAPAHDWNARIEQECYRAVGAARVPGAGGRIAGIENLYAWTSFNVGPTLLEWLEHAAPDTYAEMLAGDRESVLRLGHGNALAMPYHHAILPLSTRREKVIEVRWGIADFRRRFGRAPAGMWLPETAVDEETLDVLAQEGISFTILAPHQVLTPPPGGLPGLVTTLSGRHLAVFLYDGGISHDVAFGPLVRDAEAWAERLLAPAPDGEPVALVSVATDGETFGHHHAFGEMALARTIARMRERPEVVVENFASFLARHPATHPVTLVAPSAWSCPHGVERWRSDCGCRMAPDQPTQQRWRTPLREGLAALAAGCHRIYAEEAPALLRDAVAALDGYGSVLGSGADALRAYVEGQLRPGLPAEGRVRAAELLELERGALRSLTSCAWFFDDIAGIETLQVLRYAAWAIGLAGADGVELEQALTRTLARAESNQRTMGTGQDIYLQRARPHLAPPLRIGAGLAAARRLAPAAAASPAWVLRGPDADATLVNRRTGRQHPLCIELREAGLTLEVTVSEKDGPVIPLGLADLPEVPREAVGSVLRARALETLLSADERAGLARGEALLPVVRHALIRRVQGLEVDRGAERLQAIWSLLTILEQLGQAVPFEAQTHFYRIWRRGPADDAPMAELAGRLGFVVRRDSGARGIEAASR